MASVCALSLLGCACSETEWDGMYATPEDVQLLPAGGRCEFGNLAHVSRTSAALAGRADPHMLELARLEAERDCYKAAAREARLRLEETGTSMPLK